jgi:hypothetical protein
MEQQHVNRSFVPRRLMIAPNWCAEDVSSVEEANAAIDSLNVAIVQIEEGLAATRAKAAKGQSVDINWMSRASTAARLKKLTRQRVIEIKSRLQGETPEKLALAHVRKRNPELFSEAIETAKETFPDFGL